MNIRHTAAMGLMLWAGSAAAQIPSSDLLTIKMRVSVAYPHAGVTLAVPTGFRYDPFLTEPFQVMKALRFQGRKASQSVSLSVYPVAGGETAGQYLERLHDDMARSLSVRRLKILQTAKRSVAGRPAEAVHMTYTFRGIKTFAVSVCFLREEKASPAGSAPATMRTPRCLAYVLTVEANESQSESLPRTFDAVVRTVVLTDIRRPVDLPIDLTGPYLKDFSRGYAIHMPHGWIGGRNDVGMFTEQADYTLGAVPCPSVQGVSTLVDSARTAEICGEKAFEYERKRGVRIDVLAKGPTKLAGKDGFQFILRKSEPADGNADVAAPTATQATIEVHRILVITAEVAGKARQYAFIVVCKDVTVEQATQLADALAEGFSLIPLPEPEEE